MAKQTKAEAVKELERAEKALEAAKRKHRTDFRAAIFDVYQAYGLRLKAYALKGGNSSEEARIVIESYTGTSIEAELPE